MTVIRTTPTPYQRWQHLSVALVRGFHVYANWLVSISWKRFSVLALVLIIAANILQEIPPFTWRINEHEVTLPSKVRPLRVEPPKIDVKPLFSTDQPIHYDIKIDDKGVHIEPVAPAGSASTAVKDLPSINLDLPKDVDREDVQAGLEKARQGIEKSVREAQQKYEEEYRQQAEDARQAAQDATDAAADAEPQTRTTYIRLGDFLVNLALLFILSSAVIKAMYKSRMQAEVKAAQAEETAEAESLKRQVIEARMAAMQAQVEPHFLFNTLASIDHLIETDPPRASQMQKNLIALLRASMPTMREANQGGPRDLGRELGMIRPYLEILKVRMEERLQTEIDVPDGLLSAEFPPMMIQSLVENAIKHGLEPKAEGGSLKLKAEINHGKLVVTVADTGLGFGRAATAGTGVGLANIRERLSLLFGSKATLTVTENKPSGTIVSISVPYRSRNEEGAST